MKRFYRDVTVEQVEQGFAVRLDNRPIKTAAGQPQIVSGRALADTLATEWDDQGDELDLALFRFRDLADYAIDIIRTERSTALAKLLAFAETDTLCYRADPDEALYRRQQEVWEPPLTAFEAREGIKMERVSGIMHRAQSDETLKTLHSRLDALDEFTLAGLHTVTSLAASLCVGLSALEADAVADELWAIANLEDVWQAELWGQDAEAEARMAKRRLEFGNGFEFMRLVARSD
jgi:chaperone required for assembly of F1-ATPase